MESQALTRIGRPPEPQDSIDARQVAVCELIAEGRSVKSACAELSIGALTFYKWLKESKVFEGQYARAKDIACEALVDEIIAIADDYTQDPNRSRVQIDSRKWIVSKLLPRKYGDKLELTGEVTNITKVQVEVLPGRTD